MLTSSLSAGMSRDLLNMSAKIGAILDAHSFNSLTGITSGSDISCGWMYLNSCQTPYAEISIDVMSLAYGISRFGCLEASSILQSCHWNCLLRISTLSSSIVMIPADRVVMPNVFALGRYIPPEWFCVLRFEASITSLTYDR